MSISEKYLKVILKSKIISGPQCEISCLLWFLNKEDADQSAHSRLQSVYLTALSVIWASLILAKFCDFAALCVIWAFLDLVRLCDFAKMAFVCEHQTRGAEK